MNNKELVLKIKNEYQIVDVHTHYNNLSYAHFSSRFNDFKHKKILVVVASTNINDSMYTIELTKNFDNVFGCIGLHPCTYHYDLEHELKILEELLKNNNKKIIAIGECGLDNYNELFENNFQHKKFIKQIELSLKYNKPLIVHTYDYLGTLELLNSNGAKKVLFHSFNGTYNEFKQIIKSGFYISLSSLVFNNKELIDNLIIEDLDYVLFETDSPWLNTKDYSCKNESINVIDIYDFISKKFNRNIQNKILENFLRLFFNY